VRNARAARDDVISDRVVTGRTDDPEEATVSIPDSSPARDYLREAALPVPAPQQYRQPVPMGGVAPNGLVKRRGPIAVWLGLPLITLGVYTLVWYYKIHREMADVRRRPDAPVAGPMLVLLFLGWMFGIPVLISFFRTGNRIAEAQRAAGLTPTCNPYIGLLLCFCFGLQVAYYQTEMNKIADGVAPAIPAMR
jgi:hypothetical protein